MAKKLDLKVTETTKYIIAFMIAAVVGYCTVMGVNVAKELWTLSGAIITYIFMNSVPKAVEAMNKSSQSAWARSIIALGLTGVLCFCTIKGLEIGKEFWSLIGAIITFVFNSKHVE